MMKMRLVNVHLHLPHLCVSNASSAAEVGTEQIETASLKCIGKIERTVLLTHPKSSFHDHNSLVDVNKKIDYIFGRQGSFHIFGRF